MDLVSVSKLQAYRQDIVTLVHKSPLGILMPRVGGLPLTLTYFLSPYDLMNVQSPTIAMTQEKILENNAGISCTLGIDSSTNFQLPVISQRRIVLILILIFFFLLRFLRFFPSTETLTEKVYRHFHLLALPTVHLCRQTLFFECVIRWCFVFRLPNK